MSQNIDKQGVQIGCAPKIRVCAMMESIENYPPGAAHVPPTTLIYLHGFASSSTSAKAVDFQQRFAQRGIDLRVPDLNVPNFEHLTLTAVLARVAEEVRAAPPGSIGLIGSSMGGLAALHFADRYRHAEAAEVTHLFLMAPALDFASNRAKALGERGLESWRSSGYLTVQHHAYNETRRVHYGLYEDIMRYDSFSVMLDTAMLIVHGVHDESVDHQQSVRFAEDRPNVDLKLVDSDHKLLDQTDAMWGWMQTFFGL
jgi:hypothetical protein